MPPELIKPQHMDWRELCSVPNCLAWTRAWCSRCRAPVCPDHRIDTPTRRTLCASCEPITKENLR